MSGMVGPPLEIDTYSLLCTHTQQTTKTLRWVSYLLLITYA